MIEALVSGKLHKAPQARTAANGNRFATATVKAPVRGGSGQGEGPPPVCFVSVIVFDEAAVSALLALGEGDAVALAGEITPKVYAPAGGEPRASLDMVAHAVLSAYAVKRKRDAHQGQHQGEHEPRQEGSRQGRGIGGATPWQPPGEPSREPWG